MFTPIHRREERVITPPLSQLTAAATARRRREGQRTEEYEKVKRENYSRLLDSMGKGLLVGSGLAYEY